MARETLQVEEEELIEPRSLTALDDPSLLVLLMAVALLQLHAAHGVQVAPHQLSRFHHPYSDLRVRVREVNDVYFTINNIIWNILFTVEGV